MTYFSLELGSKLTEKQMVQDNSIRWTFSRDVRPLYTELAIVTKQMSLDECSPPREMVHGFTMLNKERRYEAKILDNNYDMLTTLGAMSPILGMMAGFCICLGVRGCSKDDSYGDEGPKIGY